MKPPAIPGYRVLESVASGGSGTVFRALQEKLGREVALKVILPELASSEEFRTRFLREARLQAGLSHPCLLKVLDAGFSLSGPYLVTEFVGGGNLRGRLARQGKLSIQEAVAIGRDIAAGLAHAHAAGIVHRDLKPENVLVTSDGRIQVADFGLARTLEGEQPVETRRGTVMGTPGYVPPEVLVGGKFGPAGDLYSLGVMLFEMLAGERPHQARTGLELLRLQVTSEARRLSSLAPAVPPELEALVMSCLERAPEPRPSSAADVVETLTRLQPPELRTAQVLLEDILDTGPGPAVSPPGSARPGPRASAPRGALPFRGTAPLNGHPTRSSVWLLLAMAALGGAVLIPWALFGLRTTSATPGGGVDTRPARDSAPIEIRAGPPEIAAVDTSSRNVRVHFRSEVLQGTELSLWPEGSPMRRTVAVPQRARSHLVTGLEPGTAYHLSVESAGQSAFRTVTTRREFAELPLIDAAAPTLLYMWGAAREETVAAAWLCGLPGQEAQAWIGSSRDCGVTWTPSLRLAAALDVGIRMSAAVSGGDVWVALCALEGGECRMQVYRHVPGESRPARILSIAAPWETVPTLTSSDATGLLLTYIDGGKLVSLRLPQDVPASPKAVAGAVALGTHLEVIDEGVDRWIAVALPARREREDRGHLALATSRRDPVSGRPVWTELSRFTAEPEDVRSFSLVRAGAEGVLVYESNNLLRWTTIGPGGLVGESSEIETPRGLDLKHPTLAVLDGEVHLAAVAFKLEALTHDLIHLRLDRKARRWIPESREPSNLLSLKQLQLVSTGGRLVLLAADRVTGLLQAVLRPHEERR